MLAANWNRVQAEQEYSSKCKRLSSSLSTYVNVFGHKVTAPTNEPVAGGADHAAQDEADADLDQPE